jgi:hypothetical protein
LYLRLSCTLTLLPVTSLQLLLAQAWLWAGGELVSLQHRGEKAWMKENENVQFNYMRGISIAFALF